MIFLSDEDADIDVIMKSWLTRQVNDKNTALANWVEQFLPKLLTWTDEKADFVLPTTKIGTIKNALSLVEGSVDKIETLFSLFRGLSANMSFESRKALSSEVGKLSPELDNGRVLIQSTWNRGLRQIEPLSANSSSRDITLASLINSMKNAGIDSLPIIETIDLKRHTDQISSWLERGDPLLLVGPEGSGILTRQSIMLNLYRQKFVSSTFLQLSQKHALVSY